MQKFLTGLVATSLFLAGIHTSSCRDVRLVDWSGTPQIWANGMLDKTEKIKGDTEEALTLQKGIRRTALEMAKIEALMQYGLLLDDIPLEQVAKIGTEKDKSLKIPASGSDGLSYDGSTFSGGNFAFVDNVKGLSGMPVALDAMAPMKVIPINQDQLNILGPLAQAFQASSSGQAMKSETIQNLIRVGGMAAQLSGNGTAGQIGQMLSMVTDGVLVRPISPLDDAYSSAFGQGSQQQAGFWVGEASRYGGYHPMLGGTSVPGLGMNMNQVFTQGALAAVQQFGGGSAGNSPLMTFAAQNAPAIMESINFTKPGEPISFAGGGFSGINNPRFRYAAGEAATASPVAAMVISPSSASDRTLQNEMESNKKRLSENFSAERREEKLREFNLRLLESLRECRAQIEKIRSRMTEENAIPEITQLLQAVNSEIAARNESVVVCDRAIESARETRRQILQDREDRRKKIVGMMQHEISEHQASMDATFLLDSDKAI